MPYAVLCCVSRVELGGVEGRGDVSVCVATENRAKAYQEVAILNKADFKYACVCVCVCHALLRFLISILHSFIWLSQVSIISRVQ